MGTSEVGLNTVLHYDMVTSLTRSGSGMWYFKENGPHSPIVSDTIRRLCWNRCGFVEGGVSLGTGFFETSDALSRPSMAVSS